ncbi:accessory factor UbiK family protein [Pelagibacteraceae bacterium]|jgi:BMFP domain-containing protein YqiC|nr:accessory factor UbiK family protein [Pelagibacteraceae bacterium]|tara:strand:+ start:834 stop:1070 length:237 start_codon:yes stop_codon:yes gene_type:complete
MNNSEKLLKLISSVLENSVLTSQDVKKEILTQLKFKKDSLAEKLNLVTREEFEMVKKIVQKQEKEIASLKKSKKVKRS